MKIESNNLILRLINNGRIHKLIVSLLCQIFLIISVNAEEVKPFIGKADDNKIDLSGYWKFKLDNIRLDGSPADIGPVYAKPGTLKESHIRDRKGYGLDFCYDKIDFDDSKWDKILVPGDWGKQGYKRAGGESYQGPAWYRQKVFIPKEWENLPIFLQLGQPDDSGMVFWNGEKVCNVEKFGKHFSIKLPFEKIKYGAFNTISVLIYNYYMGGGLIGDNFQLYVLKAFSKTLSSNNNQKMSLSMDKELSINIIDEKNWKYGWRDEGTSDTRPKLKKAEGIYNGMDAICVDIWYPNSTEFVDYRLREDENGRIWQKENYEYISFYVKSEVSGEMLFNLNKGDIRWKKGGPSYSARFFVNPGDWKKVILPFTFFYQKDDKLSDLSIIDTIAIGYGNNELQQAGKVYFANFEVGSFSLPEMAKPIFLDGLWHFKLDNIRPDGQKSDMKNEEDRNGYGIQLGFYKSDFDDSKWDIISLGKTWEDQGFPGFDGPAWYRQKVLIPKEWNGLPLKLCLGKPDDRGSVFWNGKKITEVKSFGPKFEIIIPPEEIKYGELNSIAVLIYDFYYYGGIMEGPFSISPLVEQIFLRWKEDKKNNELPVKEFDPGPTLPSADKALEVIYKYSKLLMSNNELTLDYNIRTCFHSDVKSGVCQIVDSKDNLEAIINLSYEETKKLYYGEWLNFRNLILNSKGEPVLGTLHRRLKLKYEQRDNLRLPELDEVYEDTPMGRLKLIDVIKADIPSEKDPHPYKVGGVRDFWGGRRAYFPWKEGVVINEFKDKKYREANDCCHFGYRIGRGELPFRSQYLLRILYPEDKSRYFAMDIKSGRNYQGVGFYTGVSSDNPNVPYPLSGNYQWCDHIVSLDDVTYGYRGARSVSSKYGFWIFFHDIGRVYSPQYDSGPAVAEMRLYKIEKPSEYYVKINYPEGLPRRILMMDWERQPEADPVAVSEYARLIGLNALGPVMLKWAFNGYFPNTQDYNGAPEWYGTPVHRDGFGNENCWRVYGEWLDATKAHEVIIIPRLEYGGSNKLPKEARVIGPDGKIDRCGRYVSWGANLLHPATWEDIKTLLDETIGANIKKYPNIGGILWRMRSDRVKCSYGRQDVELFCKETGRKIPEGDNVTIAKWASKTMAKEYQEWWHKKRRDFHVKIRDLLRSYRPDLKLYYYNWDPDGWSLAQGNDDYNTPNDWSDMYNVYKTKDWYTRKIERQKRLTDIDYLNRFKGGHRMTNEPHKQLKIELYKDVDGIALFAPVHEYYLSNNEPYIKYFQTGDGLAICNQFYYEEKGRTNVQGDDYETSEMTPGGPQFSMADEVLSFFHGDPNIITWTTYTIGRSFITEHRKFAQAFLALPDMRGEIVTDAVNEPIGKDVKVRKYQVKDGRIYISVAYRGFTPAEFTVNIPDVKKQSSVIDLITGKEISSSIEGQMLTFKIKSAPMELNSFLIK